MAAGAVIRSVQIPMPFPFENELDIPFISTYEMREVDRLMIEEFAISLEQMMENAGRCLATLARDRFLDGDARGRKVLVLAGMGGNGGGGLVAARRLHGWGADVQVWLTAEGMLMDDVPRHQFEVLERIGIEAFQHSEAEDAAPGPLPRDVELLIDAVIGYSLSGAPRGVTAQLIGAADGHAAPVLSLDVPSGVDATSGRVFDPSVRAMATMTLALPKEGFTIDQARASVGELFLADIGVPRELYRAEELQLEVPPTLFSRGDIVRVW